MPRMLAAVSSFSSGRAYLSLNFLLPLFHRFIPNLDYVGVNISLNNSSSLSFLNAHAPLFDPLRRMAELTPILPSSRNLVAEFNCHHPLWDSRGTSDPCGKYSTRSSAQTSSPSKTLTHPPFYFAPLAVAPPLTSPLLPPLLLFLAPGRCFRTWVLTTYQFFYLSPTNSSICPSLPGPSPQRGLRSFNFQKARWDDFVFYFDFHCSSAEE